MTKLETLIDIQCQLSQLSPRCTQIDRVGQLSSQDFFLDYYTQNKPVIITGAIESWTARQWTPQLLKERYGHLMVEVQADRDRNPNFEIEQHNHRRNILLTEYIDRICDVGGNDLYMTANNHLLKNPDFRSLLDDIEPLDYLSMPEVIGSSYFWLGGGGANTPLHHDPVNIMMAHLYGRKHWRLVDPRYTNRIYNHISVYSEIDLEHPDCDRYPLAKDVPVVDAILEPGELLFVPIGWWHQVKSLDASISISFTNFVYPNLFSIDPPPTSRIRHVDPKHTISDPFML